MKQENKRETKTNLRQTAIIWLKIKNQMNILRAGGAPIPVRVAPADELWSESAQAQNCRGGSCLHLQPTQLNK